MYYGQHPDDLPQENLGFVAPILGAVGVGASLIGKIFGDKKEEKERKKLEKAVKKAEQLQEQQLMVAQQMQAQKEREQKMWLYTLGAAGAIVIGLLIVTKATKK